ncbi:MAG: hypothetical protein NVSMB47_10130 [Polyangiales bacterium]
MRTRSIPFTLTILLAVTLAGLGGALALAGCDKEKSGAEKLAEELASANSQQKLAVSASNAAPDPAEVKYKERKSGLEKTVTDMKADEMHVMAKDPSATPGILSHYFESGADGEKAAQELEAKRKKDGLGGYSIKKARIVDTRLSGTLEDAELDVVEETAQKGTSACLLQTQAWKYKDGKWIFQRQVAVKKVDCE